MNSGAIAGFAGFGVLFVVLVVFVLRFVRQLGRRTPTGSDRAAAPTLDDHASDGGDRKGKAEDRAPEPKDQR
jgi:hypothetical protein